MSEAFNVLNLIRCPYEAIPKDNPDTYVIRPKPLKGTLSVSFDNLGFMSGQVKVRRMGGGKYPFHYLEMIDYVFGSEENTIEVCSGSVSGCFTVDLNPKQIPRLLMMVKPWLKFQMIHLIDGDVTLLTTRIQLERCTELIYQNQFDCLKKGLESAKSVLFYSCFWVQETINGILKERRESHT